MIYIYINYDNYLSILKYIINTLYIENFPYN